MNSTVKEGKFQGGQGGQARRASLEEVEGSMALISCSLPVKFYLFDFIGQHTIRGFNSIRFLFFFGLQKFSFTGGHKYLTFFHTRQLI